MCGMMQHIFIRKDLQIGGLDVQGGEIIDNIDGYEGKVYRLVLTQIILQILVSS